MLFCPEDGDDIAGRQQKEDDNKWRIKLRCICYCYMEKLLELLLPF
jgi:hypothetical protein